ncbi:hypothetical protein D3C76_651550 [compost metagenome]
MQDQLIDRRLGQPRRQFLLGGQGLGDVSRATEAGHRLTQGYQIQQVGQRRGGEWGGQCTGDEGLVQINKGLLHMVEKMPMNPLQRRQRVDFARRPLAAAEVFQEHKTMIFVFQASFELVL